MQIDHYIAILKYSRSLLSRENGVMETHFPIILATLTVLLIQCGSVLGQTRTEYTINIGADGSALWTIAQAGADIQVSNDTIAEFQQKVALLVDSARNETGRVMDANSTSIAITPSGSYIVIEYRFYWANFSKTENSKIIVGDVFRLPDFFLRLYGDGEVSITYPTEYVAETILPTPYEQKTSLQTIRWLGILNFGAGQPSIVLGKRSSSSAFADSLEQNAFPITAAIIIAGGTTAGLYVFRQHRKKEEIGRKPPNFLPMESDEDRIVKLLKSSGGSMYQSAIVEQCRFSKAKTSQLLASLENRGLVSRFKKGRDKIVSVIKQNKSEQR